MNRFILGLLTLCVLAGAVVTTGCGNRYVRRAAGLLGEEAAYTSLKSALTRAGVRSADHFVDAIRLVADHRDYGGATAKFTQALAEHNVAGADKLTSSQVISILRRAVPTVREASSRVANAITSFCDHAARS